MAFLLSWLIVFTGIVAVSTVTLGFAGYLNALTRLPKLPIAILLIILLSYLNFRGIKESSRFNTIVTSFEVGGLIFIILLGLGHFGKINYIDMPNGISGVLSDTSLIFFAFLGFETIVNMAEETKTQGKSYKEL